MGQVSIFEEGEIANYVFLSWYRQGMSTVIGTKSNNGRAQINLRLKVNEHDIDQNIELIGPGDIKSFNDKVITRIDPKNHIGDFEPNYFPIIEFSEADFPWRYTPIQAETISDKNHRLKPWICLIVLEAKDETKSNSIGEFNLGSPGTSKTLPSIKVKKRDGESRYPLPDLNEIWAWAHVQITTNKDAKEIDDTELKSITKNNPEQILSRIICPRWLDPGKLYNAFVVPTFETGRKAGLGFKNSEIISVDVDTKAWDVTEEGNEIEIPYYYKWEFRTGLRGDFEYLVRLLEARIIDERVGVRQMDCSDYGQDMPAVNVANPPDNDPQSVLRLEGALRAVTSKTTEWPKGSNDNVQEEYKKLLNLTDEQIRFSPTTEQKIKVVPPIYAKWHAMRNKLEAADRPWINDLNLDPRYRTTAGFGTSVIQTQQESLMHSAWKQVGEIEEANELLRTAQLSQIVSTKIYEKNIKPLSTTALLGMSYPLMPRIIYDDSETEKITLKEKVKSSRIKSTIDPAFLRIFRKRGPIKKRAKAEEQEESHIDRINKGEIKGDEEIKSHSPSIKDISEDYRPPWAKGLLWKFLKPLGTILLILAIVLSIILWGLSQYGMIIPQNHPIIIVLGIILAILGFILRRFITPGIVADNITEENLTPEFVASIPARPNFVLTTPGTNIVQMDTGGQDNQTASEFRAYAITVQGFLSFIPPEPPEPEELDLSKIQGTIIDALNPKFTIANRINRRVLSDLIKPIEDQIVLPMAAPIFEQPMYVPLRDKSQELLLPGLEHVPQNTVGLVEENRKFIESYLCGCSHEMARELLWREYPTDQRGTYFRQFWDVSDVVRLPGTTEQLRQQVISDPSNNFSDLTNDEEKENAISEKIEEVWNEKLRDIEKIYKWQRTKLGFNITKGSSDPNENKLVLLIRGDLLKKYPSTVIYANQARWKEDPPLSPPTVPAPRWPADFPIEGNDDELEGKIIQRVKMPVFKGTLPPDVTFLGFELTEDQAKGSKNFGEEPGWFFVIEERISESRFGADALTGNAVDLETWNDLSWDHLKENNWVKYAEDPTGHVRVISEGDKLKPHNNEEEIIWGENSSSIAWITLQKPFRMAIHADDMLPKDDSND